MVPGLADSYGKFSSCEMPEHENSARFLDGGYFGSRYGYYEELIESYPKNLSSPPKSVGLSDPTLTAVIAGP